MKLINQKDLFKLLKVTPQKFRNYIKQNNIKSYLIDGKIFYNKQDFKMELLEDSFIRIRDIVEANQHISRQRIHQIIKNHKIKKYKILDNFDKNIYVRKSDLKNIKQFN